MLSSFSPGPYPGFLGADQYLCRFNFCGWTSEVLAKAHAGFASFNSLWEQGGGPYRGRKMVFQGSNVMRSASIRIGKSFRISGRSEDVPAARGMPVTSQELAAAADKRVTGELKAGQADFRSMAIHDMKSSLVLIGGFIQRLTSFTGADPERQHKYLEIIRKETCKLEALLDDFVACTEINRDLRLESRPALLDRELQDLCEAYQIKAARRKTVLQLESPPKLSPVLADIGRLQRVFGNLLDNALKFSPPGSTIQVMIRETRDEVLVSFADDGPGIDTRDLPYLFDAHYRGRSGGQIEGSGLGLATVKAIVEAHGGRVIAANRPEGGSLFKVILPRDGKPGQEEAGKTLQPLQQSPAGSDSVPAIQ